MEIDIKKFLGSVRHWLDNVAAGGEILITERGKPVARLVGVSREVSSDRLVKEGLITPAIHPAPKLTGARRGRARKPVSDLVKQQRR